MNNNNTYIVATIRPWNIKAYQDIIRHYPGKWHLVTKPEQLSLRLVNKIKPRYIFFPHWSAIVPNAILNAVECVCFHETDLPYGRGGSPIQNLIVRGHAATTMTALRMTSIIDGGPIYQQRSLSLKGSAQEIFVRASLLAAAMIRYIIQHEPKPVKQKGKPVIFKRRTPGQSQIPLNCKTLTELFNHIRMLDAAEYPKAFINHGQFRYEFSNALLNKKGIDVKVVISKRV